MIHYTYIVKHQSGKYYVGRHSTDNIDDGYLGSGKWVRSIKDKSLLDKSILDYYESFDDLKLAEEKLIAEHIDQPNNMNFNNSSIGFATGDRNPSADPIRRKMMSEMFSGDKNPMKNGHSEDAKRKISESTAGDKNPMYGRNHSDDAKRKISEANTGRQYSEETKKIWSEQRKGKETWNKGTKGEFTIGEEGKRKISESWANRKKLVCPYCGKETFPNTYKRWHGDNCKQKDME